AYRYEYDHDVFVIYRPWNECARCWARFKENQLAFEDERDYVCPHTRKAEYLALRRRMLHEGLVPLSYREIELKTGVVQVSLAWGVRGATPGARAAPPRLWPGATPRAISRRETALEQQQPPQRIDRYNHHGRALLAIPDVGPQGLYPRGAEV